MPIKGLSEAVRVPRLGKIRLGMKVESQGTKKPYPKALDYFNCPPEVEAVYGPEPRSLDIVFPTDDDERIAAQYYRLYLSSRSLACKGTGETARRLVDKLSKHADENGEVIGEVPKHDAADVEWLDNIPCPGEGCIYRQRGDCKPVMNLQFLLPRVPGLGIWQVDTGSIYSIININSALKLARSAVGSVAFLPFTLQLVPQEVAPNGRKKRVFVLTLTMARTWSQLAASRDKPFYLLEAPAPDEADPDLPRDEGEVPEDQATAGDVVEPTRAPEAVEDRPVAPRSAPAAGEQADLFSRPPAPPRPPAMPQAAAVPARPRATPARAPEMNAIPQTPEEWARLPISEPMQRALTAAGRRLGMSDAEVQAEAQRVAGDRTLTRGEAKKLTDEWLARPARGQP